METRTRVKRLRRVPELTTGSPFPSSVKNQSYWGQESRERQFCCCSSAGGTPTDLQLTFWMSVSTILYWSGMCVTMWVMLSSVVRTRVGPKTMARFLGSICQEEPGQVFGSSGVLVQTKLEHEQREPYETLFFSEFSATVFR